MTREESSGPLPPILRHRTAIRRHALSRPIKTAISDSLLTADSQLLDYGCGHGGDVRHLAEIGLPSRGWDPIFAPAGDRSPADVVNLGYVVNVIENEQEREEVLRDAWSRARKLLIVSARLKQDLPQADWQEFGDGCLTKVGTFQKYYDQAELRDWIDKTVEQPSVAAAPGVFYVFREPSFRETYLSGRFRRQIAVPRLAARATHEEDERLPPLAAFFTERGRLPRGGELALFPEIIAAFGTVTRAFRRIRTITDAEHWQQVRSERFNDLLVYLALGKFNGRPRIHALPEATQFDIRDFFGTYSAACRDADTLLHAAGDGAIIEEACRESLVGKRTPTSLYMHVSAVPRLPTVLRIYEGCARVLMGNLEGANVIKLHRDKPAVSYLWYPSFDEEGHPELMGAFIVFLDSRQVRYRDYSRNEKPPILHRKEEMVSADYPRRRQFADLTRQEEAVGLYEDVAIIGTRSGWNAVLTTKGVSVRGHELTRTGVVDGD